MTNGQSSGRETTGSSKLDLIAAKLRDMRRDLDSVQERLQKGRKSSDSLRRLAERLINREPTPPSLLDATGVEIASEALRALELGPENVVR